MEFSKYRISNYIICILKSEFKVSKHKIVKTFELKLPEVLCLKGRAIIIIIITSGVLFCHQFFCFCRQYLLPITSRPDIGSRDVTALFDLQGQCCQTFI